jgi:folate-binding protein YgfZ
MLTAGGPMAGYEAIRRSAVLAMVPRSVLVLEGADTFDFLHRMSTNDIRTIGDGESRRTVFVNEKGRVVDLVTVLRAGPRAIIVGSPTAAGTLSAWLGRFIIMDDVRIAVAAELPAVRAVYGPEAAGFARETRDDALTIREDLGRIPGLLFISEFPGIDRQGGVAGSAGVDTLDMFDRLEKIDPATFETIRIEEQVPAAGRELGPDVNALEAGLKGVISFSKGCYIGQEVIARLDTYRKLRTIIAQFRIGPAAGRVPSAGNLMQAGVEAGRITSVAHSPLLEGWIGLGFRQIRTADARFELMQPGDGPPLEATCISPLPPGYEEYEIEG